MEKGEKDLDTYIKERGHPLHFLEFFVVLKLVITALTHLHGKGIAHRDLKPENILMFLSGCQWRITDFGISLYLQSRIENSQEGA